MLRSSWESLTLQQAPTWEWSEEQFKERGVLFTNQRKTENAGRRMKNVLPRLQPPENPGVHNRENLPVAPKTFLRPFPNKKKNNKNQIKKKIYNKKKKSETFEKKNAPKMFFLFVLLWLKTGQKAGTSNQSHKLSVAPRTPRTKRVSTSAPKGSQMLP